MSVFSKTKARFRGVCGQRDSPVIDAAFEKRESGMIKQLLTINTSLPPDIRKKKVLAIRHQLVTGNYDIEERLGVAVDRLLEQLIPSG